jgi:hypothetical protein
VDRPPNGGRFAFGPLTVQRQQPEETITMTDRAYDATGTEHSLPICKEDTTVEDAAGVPRKLLAGQPVPLDLLEAYRAEVGPDKKAAVPPAPPAIPTRRVPASATTTAPQPPPELSLDGLSREQLDQVAGELGVEEPDKLPNKGAVNEAIAKYDAAAIAAAVESVKPSDS